jgi:hypothetical protein
VKYLAILFLFVTSTAHAARVELSTGDVQNGTWVVSKIVSTVSVQGEYTFSTQAIEDNIGAAIDCKYPPMSSTWTYYLGYALCRVSSFTSNPSADTIVLPNLRGNLSLNNNQWNRIEEKFPGYTFYDRDGSTVTKGNFNRTQVDGTGVGLVKELVNFAGHSKRRDIPIVDETHNTEYLDDFDSDPASRWTQELQAFTWDNVNGEIDINHVGTATLFEYTANSPGSIEHEAQVMTNQSPSETRMIGAAVRVNGGAADDFYAVGGDRGSSQLRLWKRSGGAFSVMGSVSVTFTNGNYYSFRISAEGGAGSNVTISVWHTDHGISKPSDPGWIGTVGAETGTTTDTAADRLDDSVHDGCGIGGQTAVSTDYDTRHDYFKERAISDRDGAAPTKKFKQLYFMRRG